MEELKSRICFIIPKMNSRDEDEIAGKMCTFHNFKLPGSALDPTLD